MSCKKETIYRIFAINDPALVSLILKMVYQFTKMNHNLFCYKDLTLAKHYQSQKEFALLSENLIFHSMKDRNTMVINLDYMNGDEKKKKSKETLLLKKTRLFKKEHIFDSITLSLDFMNSVDEILKCFDISKFYMDETLICQYLNKNSSQTSPSPTTGRTSAGTPSNCLPGSTWVGPTLFLLGWSLISRKELCNVTSSGTLRMSAVTRLSCIWTMLAFGRTCLSKKNIT
jgi:hypothetical protein